MSATGMAAILTGQATMGPHAVSLGDIGLLVAGVLILFLVFPYLQTLPLVWRNHEKL